MARIFSTCPFYMQYVCEFTPWSPHHIQNNPKLWPFFKGMVGAIDGSHININCPASMHNACRNRKGFLLQNCLFACSFNMLFTYALCGWEGSASDAHLWENVKGLHLPEGCFLLVDPGFPHCEKLLVPYRGGRYHLSESGSQHQRLFLFVD